MDHGRARPWDRRGLLRGVRVVPPARGSAAGSCLVFLARVFHILEGSAREDLEIPAEPDEERAHVSLFLEAPHGETHEGGGIVHDLPLRRDAYAKVDVVRVRERSISPDREECLPQA